MVYGRVGSGLLNSFDRFGSFGLSTQITNSVLPDLATAPRVTGLNTIPTVDQTGQTIFPPRAAGRIALHAPTLWDRTWDLLGLRRHPQDSLCLYD